MADPTRRRLWLVGVLLWLAAVLFLWWPAGLEFRSDDHLAIAWSCELGGVGHDFTGPYQGAERLALFYRPLITLSVAIDGWLGGYGPLLPGYGELAPATGRLRQAGLMPSLVWNRTPAELSGGPRSVPPRGRSRPRQRFGSTPGPC